MTPDSKPLLRTIREWIYNLWCFFCLYSLGAIYIPIEINRKYDLINKVRKLNYDEDLPQSMAGTVAVVTGGSRGIGWETAKTLIARGCHVIVASSVANGPPMKQLREKLIRDLKKDSDPIKGKLDVWHLDLTSMDSVKQFAKRFSESGLHLNVLINNAGLMYAPHKLTVDRYESHWAINYLSHCLLVALLLPHLERTGAKSATKSRIINVASSTHFARNLSFDDLNGDKLYSPYHAYAQSKLAQIMFSYKLHQVMAASDKYNNVRVLALHPGVAKTELYEHVWWVVAFPFIADQLFRVRHRPTSLLIT